MKSSTFPSRARTSHGGGSWPLWPRSYAGRMGEIDAFNERMSQALQSDDLPILELMRSPLFAAARSEPRFQALL